MGLYNRDYLRDDRPTSAFTGMLEGAPVTRAIIIGTVIAMIVQLVWRTDVGGYPSPVLDEWFSMDVSAVLRGQVWRLLSYAFLHDIGSLWHILFNMLFLWYFGSRIEQMYGGREYLLFYCFAAVTAAVGFTGWSLAFGEASPMVGASGAVLGVAMLFTMHYPRELIGLFFGLITIEMRYLMLLVIAVDSFPLLSQLGDGQRLGNVAHAAHLIGVLFGYLYYRFQWRFAGMLGWGQSIRRRWRQARARRHLRPYNPEPEREPLMAEMDLLLEKVHQHGEASLTKKERETLERASRALRDRK